MKIRFPLIPGTEDAARGPGRARASIGIDLGTTNSAVAVAAWDPADPTVLDVHGVEVDQPTLTEGVMTDALMPSVVAMHDGRTWVGEGAKRIVSSESARGRLKNRDLFYEAKNEIGTDRTYHLAPEGFRTPGEIGGHLLRTLKAAAETEPDRIVVTVPASFQQGQRLETTQAAAHAGFDLLALDLLDEPVAAFIDYLAGHPEAAPTKPGELRNLLVFDFGGGTCDIAVLTLGRNRNGLTVSPRSVSRFHRLGGGDIDAAIVYDVLIPQLIAQGGLSKTHFGFADKTRALEPALRPVAESLKIGLCQEIVRRRGLELPLDGDLARPYPGTVDLSVAGATFRLSRPTLSLSDFERVLAPFLDRTILSPQADEYRHARSIFAPLTDALSLGDLEPDDISHCLLVGGSSSIPQIADAVGNYLPRAEVLTYTSPAERKLCVARGAAIAAAHAAVLGRPLVTSVCHEDIILVTRDGHLPLVGKGTPLPFPQRGEAGKPLQAPTSSTATPLPLRLELRTAPDERLLSFRIWEIDAPVRAGEPLRLNYRLDANNVLHLRLGRPDRPDGEEFRYVIENPLTHVQNPSSAMVRAEELERQLGRPSLPPGKRRQGMLELVSLLDELGRREKALEVLKQLLAKADRPDAWIINRMAMLVDNIGDGQEAGRLYEAAARANEDWHVPLFNLALKLRREQDAESAAEAALRSIERERSAPTLTLYALAMGDCGDEAAKHQALEEARALWDPVETLDPWELGWKIAWARAANDEPALRKARADQDRRNKGAAAPADIRGELPALGAPE